MATLRVRILDKPSTLQQLLARATSRGRARPNSGYTSSRAEAEALKLQLPGISKSRGLRVPAFALWRTPCSPRLTFFAIGRFSQDHLDCSLLCSLERLSFTPETNPGKPRPTSNGTKRTCKLFS